MKPVPWSVVAVVGIVVAGLVSLTLAGKDTAALGGLAALILAGVGLIGGTVLGVKENTNGTITKLTNVVEGLAHRLGDAPSPTQGQRPLAESDADAPVDQQAA